MMDHKSTKDHCYTEQLDSNPSNVKKGKLAFRGGKTLNPLYPCKFLKSIYQSFKGASKK